MPAIGLSFRSGGGIHDIVCTDHQRHVGPGKSPLISSISDQAFVWHVGFCREHVHMAGHAASHRMNRETDIHAAPRQHIVHFAKLMLGLRHRHAIAGNNDHAARGIQNLSGLFWPTPSVLAARLTFP